MVHFNQNKTMKTLIASVLRSQQVQVDLEDSINIAYNILDKIFQILDTENVPVKQITPYLTILLKKSGNDIANIIKKTHTFMRKTKSYLKKYTNDFEKLPPDFSEEGKEERIAGYVGQNIPV